MIYLSISIANYSLLLVIPLDHEPSFFQTITVTKCTINIAECIFFLKQYLKQFKKNKHIFKAIQMYYVFQFQWSLFDWNWFSILSYSQWKVEYQKEWYYVWNEAYTPIIIIRFVDNFGTMTDSIEIANVLSRVRFVRYQIRQLQT